MDALFSDYEDLGKSGLFDPEYYLAAYPDVADRNLDPLVHYLEEGAAEGRNPSAAFDTAFYLEQCRIRGEAPQNPLLHYLRVGKARGFETKPAKGKKRRTRQDQTSLPEAGKAPILVAIESLGVTGAAGGKSRLSVGGWALGGTAIQEITVALEGELAGTATYGLARPDVARLYPDRPGAAASGFLLALDLPRGRSGVVEPILSIRTVEGEVGNRALNVEIPPQELEVDVVDPLAPAARQRRNERQPMEVCVDDASVDESGILRVNGWVVCLVQIESVEALVGNTAIGAAEFGRVRIDIEQMRPDYPNARFSGFTLATDVGHYGGGRQTVTIRASARGGIARQVTVPVQIPERLAAPRRRMSVDLQYHTDELTLTTGGRLLLRGWIVGPSPLGSIGVSLDGEVLGEAKTGLERPDIGNLFPRLPHARRSGFAFEHATGKVTTGDHRVTLRIARRDGQIDEADFPVTASAEKETAATAASDSERKLQIDAPVLIDGVAVAPVRGNLEISGWALARAGVEAIEIALDGAPVAVADYGQRRLDIRAAFPRWENSLTSGYTAVLPQRVLSAGAHTIAVTLRDKAGGTTGSEFQIDVGELSEVEGPWSLRQKMRQAEADLALRLVARGGCRPCFTVILPVRPTKAARQKAMLTIASLCRQVYGDWRLMLTPEGATTIPRTTADELLAALRPLGDRGEILNDISGRRLPALMPGFVTVLSPGDELGCDALLEMAVASAMHPDADFLYSDERSLNVATGKTEAFFKPQWSPELLLSRNYIGRLWCARSELVGQVNGPDQSLLQAGEYDLLLRLTEAAGAIRHVPAVLCERDAAAAPMPAADKAAIEQALARRGTTGAVEPGAVSGTWRVRRALKRPGLVSIVIPTCAADGMIETCVNTLKAVTAYRNFEIVCIENIPPKDRKWRGWLKANVDRVIAAQEPFNWARFNNRAVAQSRGEYLLFLNDDVEIGDPHWLDGLLEHAQRPEIGVVGARLLYPDERVQHAGMFLGDNGHARHAFRYAGAGEPGYFGLARTQRNVIAVTGACLMTRRDTFDRLGGFDERQTIVNNDLDFCLRAWESGLLNIYTPFVTLTHHEAISRSQLEDEYDKAAFDGKWGPLFAAGDPYFNPHLTRMADDYSIDYEPTRLLVTGRPVYRPESIRKILVVKLDHIGDCVLAMPALRRLKHHFPQASITVLCSKSSRPVWALEPSVDATLTFDFFHARSGLGELAKTPEDWRELQQRLAPERFDLAIDLRKHLETRIALQYSGARYLAGFDCRDQFPWLDIAIEGEMDQIYTRKRHHNGDDLVNLVEAVAAAGMADRMVIQGRPAPSPAVAALKARLAGRGPLVCLHPTVGNDARQWPAEYFALVADRLVAEDHAHIVLIGGPGDEDVANTILNAVRRPEAVTSMVGKLPLDDLPALLIEMSLFVGNNSGPKHIAAGLGVPTVGVHSGTEDVIEWGPVGPVAVALSREVVCAPCYLANAEDCRRGLVCLRDLEPARVYDACKRLLALTAPAPSVTASAAQPARARRRSGNRTKAVAAE